MSGLVVPEPQTIVLTGVDETNCEEVPDDLEFEFIDSNIIEMTGNNSARDTLKSRTVDVSDLCGPLGLTINYLRDRDEDN
jgi:hypothetical protein